MYSRRASRSRKQNKTRSKNPVSSAYKSMLSVKRKLEGPAWSQFNAYELDQIKKAKTLDTVNRLATNFTAKNYTKRHLLDTTGTTRDGNVQHNTELTNSIVQGDGINDRERQIIFVKGVTASLYVRNLDETQPVNLRWALVLSKGAQPTVSANDDFYVGTGTGRYINFDSVSNGLHHTTYPINRDKWKVLAEGKYTLAPARISTSISAFYSGDMPSHIQMNRFIPVGEKIEYEGTSISNAMQHLYFMYWAVDPSQNSTAADTSQIFSRLHTITHFVEPN